MDINQIRNCLTGSLSEILDKLSSIRMYADCGVGLILPPNQKRTFTCNNFYVFKSQSGVIGKENDLLILLVYEDEDSNPIRAQLKRFTVKSVDDHGIVDESSDENVWVLTGEFAKGSVATIEFE